MLYNRGLGLQGGWTLSLICANTIPHPFQRLWCSALSGSRNYDVFHGLVLSVCHVQLFCCKLSHSGSVGFTGGVPQGCSHPHCQPDPRCLRFRNGQCSWFGSSSVPARSICCLGVCITLVCQSQGRDFGTVNLFSTAGAWIEAAGSGPLCKR